MSGALIDLLSDAPCVCGCGICLVGFVLSFNKGSSLRRLNVEIERKVKRERERYDTVGP